MSQERIDAFLDGELPRDALTAEELARAAEMQRVVDAAAEPLRRAPVPDIAAGVMARLAEAGTAREAVRESAFGRARSWLWGQRTLTMQWRPAYAMAGAFVILVLVLSGGPGSEPVGSGATTQQEAAEGAARLYVQFRLDAPDAQRVELAGSFTNWVPAHELYEATPGVWTVVVPLDPGVHDYTFVVDGERWVVDPYAAQIEDDFGGSNSRLFLPTPLPGA